MRRLVRLLIASQLVVAGLLAATPVGAAADAYTIIDLGTLGGVGSGAAGINEAGSVVGTTSTSWGEPHAFRWSAGSMTGIHAMGGWGSEGHDISDDGWVVGSAGNNNGYAEAMYWFGADPHPAGTLGDTWSQAFAINNDHQIVGRSPNSEGLIEAFSWSAGVMTGLGGLVAGDCSEAWRTEER